VLREVFGNEYQDAKITIEIGDYKVTMEGQMHPPEIITDRFEENIFSRRKFEGGLVYNDMREVNMKLRPKGKIDIKQWRWTIPLATPPRIEQ
jgi:hypothetical protein